MSSFTKPLTLTYLPKKNMWKTNKEFTYFVGSENSKDKITVPRNFLTDLASVPWPFTNLIPKSGRWNQSAVLHDYLYHTQKRSRKESDKIFYEAMKVLKVPFWKRRVMFSAVRSFGWIPWNKRKKEINQDKQT